MRRINLLAIYDSDDFSKQKLEKYAKEKDVSKATLYRWKKELQK